MLGALLPVILVLTDRGYMEGIAEKLEYISSLGKYSNTD